MQVRSLHWFSAAAVVLAAVASSSGPPGDRVLDAVVADYHEDAPGGRPIAALAARLLGRGGVRWLELVVAARGPRVVPLPGLEGVHGANLKTAQELHRLLRDGRLRPLVRDAARREAGSGTVVAVETERLPARRLRADGDVDLAASTQAAWPVEVVIASDPLPEAACTFELLVDGVSRLRVGIDGSTIASIESLGEPPFPLLRGAPEAGQ